MNLVLILTSNANVSDLIITLVILFILAIIYVVTEVYKRFYKDRNKKLKNTNSSHLDYFIKRLDELEKEKNQNNKDQENK